MTRTSFATRTLRCVTACLALMVVAAAAPAQQPQQKPEEAIAQLLFAPELVMQHQQKIGLKPAQRTAITTAIQEVQAQVIEVQWKMQEEMAKLLELLGATPVNESAT